MNRYLSLSVVIAAMLWTCSTTWAEEPAAQQDTNTVTVTVTPEQQIADLQKKLESRLSEIDRKLEELITYFGGGRTLYVSDSFDRRFRDLNDKIDRMQRDIDRLR